MALTVQQIRNQPQFFENTPYNLHFQPLITHSDVYGILSMAPIGYYYFRPSKFHNDEVVVVMQIGGKYVCDSTIYQMTYREAELRPFSQIDDLEEDILKKVSNIKKRVLDFYKSGEHSSPVITKTITNQLKTLRIQPISNYLLAPEFQLEFVFDEERKNRVQQWREQYLSGDPEKQLIEKAPKNSNTITSLVKSMQRALFKSDSEDVAALAPGKLSL